MAESELLTKQYGLRIRQVIFEKANFKANILFDN